MKYIEINLDRAVELYKLGKVHEVFIKHDKGELKALTSFSGTFGMFVRNIYFEQTEED